LVIDYARTGIPVVDEGEAMRLQLTKRTDYAIRACLHLAREDRCPISGRLIAERMGIPDRFLPQVMADLTRAGIVGAVNGKHGGYCLRRDATSVSLLQLVDAVEGPGSYQGCATGDGPHGGDAGCILHPVWAEAQAAFIGVLSRTSIAELAAHEGAAVDGIGRKRPERIER
jgi:Rrf2 family protein